MPNAACRPPPLPLMPPPDADVADADSATLTILRLIALMPLITPALPYGYIRHDADDYYFHMPLR